MSYLKKILGPAKDVLAIGSLAVGLFLTFRDKFQINLKLILEISKVPFLGSALVVLLGLTPIFISIFLMRRKKPSSLLGGYKIPYYSPRTRKLVRNILYTYFIILPLLGASLIAIEVYRQAFSLNPLQVQFIDNNESVKVKIINTGKTTLFIENIRLEKFPSSIIISLKTAIIIKPEELELLDIGPIDIRGQGEVLFIDYVSPKGGTETYRLKLPYIS